MAGDKARPSGDLVCGLLFSCCPEHTAQPHQVLLSLCNQAPKEPSFFRNCWMRMCPGRESWLRGDVPTPPLSVPRLCTQRQPPAFSLGSQLPIMPSLPVTPPFIEPRTFLDEIHSTVLGLRGQFAPLLCLVQVVGSSQSRGQIDHGLFCTAPGKSQEGGHASRGQGAFRAQSVQGFRGCEGGEGEDETVGTQHPTGFRHTQVLMGKDQTLTCDPDEAAEIPIGDDVGIRAAGNFQSPGSVI